MKKFGLLLGAFLILTGLTFWDNGLKDIYTAYGNARVCFYVTEYEELDLSGFSEDVLLIKNGAGIIVDAPGGAAARIRQGFSDIKGESVSFAGGNGDALEIISLYRARILSEEIIPLDNEGNSIRVFYGFSKLLTASVTLDGQKVNIQVAVNGQSGRVTVGTPLILGSY